MAIWAVSRRHTLGQDELRCRHRVRLLFAVARRLNLDFVIGLGYWGGTYYEYLPMDNHYVWQATRQRHWFGPTKAEISLVWLLGRGNYNQKKGGVQ